MMRDHQNYLDVVFLTLIVWEYERLNADFQKTNPDLLYLHNQLEIQYKSMKERIEYAGGKKKGIKKPLSEVGFGSDFISKCQVGGVSLSMDQLEVVKETCHQFLMTAVEETEKRLPPEGTNRGHLSKMSQLYPRTF
jgi:hypothetical protein